MSRSTDKLIIIELTHETITLRARLDKAREALSKLAKIDNYATEFDGHVRTPFGHIIWEPKDDEEREPWSFARRALAEMEKP